MSMVAAGLGVTVAPASFKRAGLAAVNLSGFDLSRDVGLVFSDRAREQTGAFVEAVRATYGRRETRGRRKVR
jgi:DNA-binding transcriptional LysR family regulator